jgi:hypothetical protein
MDANKSETTMQIVRTPGCSRKPDDSFPSIPFDYLVDGFTSGFALKIIRRNAYGVFLSRDARWFVYCGARRIWLVTASGIYRGELLELICDNFLGDWRRPAAPMGGSTDGR